MEAFEQIVKAFLETVREGDESEDDPDDGPTFAVTGPVKFRLLKRVEKASGRIEDQHHGYEVDIVAARANELLLGSVKSYFGSKGVRRSDFAGLGGRDSGGYRMLVDPVIRDGILEKATRRYGFDSSQVRFALFVGKWASTVDEGAIRSFLGTVVAGGGPVLVYDTSEMIEALMRRASRHVYVDDPVIVTLKMLLHAGLLAPDAQIPHSAIDATVDEVGDDEDSGS